MTGSDNASSASAIAPRLSGYDCLPRPRLPPAVARSARGPAGAALAAAHTMMTPRQRSFYFSLWNQVCVEQGWYHLPQAQKDAKRRALHAQAGCPASSKEFTNRHFDAFRAHCAALLAGKKTGGAAVVEEAGERRRLVWRIKADAKRGGLADAYIRTLARGLCGLGAWEDLDLASLTNLRATIHNRAAAHVAAARRDNEPF